MARYLKLVIFLTLILFSASFNQVFAQADPPAANPEVKAKLNPEFEVKNKYIIRYSQNSQYFIYVTATKESHPIASYMLYQNDTGAKRLALYSKLGFRFENIPMDNNYFYNESIHIFLLAEDRLPKTKACLEKHEFKTRPIKDLVLRFPDHPIMSEHGYTYFKVLKCKVENNCEKEKKKAKPVYEEVSVVGVHFEGTNTCVVTASWGFYPDEWVTSHEFIHYCGYGEDYHGKPVFDCSHF